LDTTNKELMDNFDDGDKEELLKDHVPIPKLCENIIDFLFSHLIVRCCTVKLFYNFKYF
jgi:hypothetical protein